VNLRDLCECAVAEARLAWPSLDVELTGGENMAADVDPRRFQQMLQNLLANAVTYGAPGRPVRVSLRRSFGFCVTTVRNEGDPIPEELVPFLFQPFRRGPHTGDARQRGHMGLGLFIVQQIAHAHGGDVHVASRPNGTEFSVRILVEHR
jgi:signal transduction histidine kinase